MGECAQAARKAIELNPSSAPAHFRLAIALFHQARLDEAARAFERTIAVDPEYFEAHYVLGTALKKLGRSTEAAREMALAEQIQARQRAVQIQSVSH